MIRKVAFFWVVFVASCFSQVEKEEVKIVTEDIVRFWDAFDLANPNFNPSSFETYLLDGSKGLKDFTSEIKSAKSLAKAVKSNKGKYEAIRNASLSIEKDERAKIEKAFNNLKELLPKIFYPDIYFVIGKMNIGSSISDNGIIIGYETMSIMGNQSLIPLIMHEVIHFQQNYNPEDDGLLARCINEGAANLISEIAIEENKNFSHNNDVYAFANEKELWRQFNEDMKANNLENWLYDGKILGNGPKHMGYWIGYQIVKSYFLLGNDKKETVKEILNIKDFEEFLKKSRYALKFE